MDVNKNNSLLGSLKTLFDVYSIEDNLQDITAFYRFLFEKKIVDIKRLDVFQINTFIDDHVSRQPISLENENLIKMKRLRDDEEQVLSYKNKPFLFRDFLSAIYFILIIHQQSSDSGDDEEMSEKLQDMLNQGLNPETILTEEGIFKLDNQDNKNMNVMKCILLQENYNLDYCFPKFSNPDITELIDHLKVVQDYNSELYTIFSKNKKYDEILNTEYIMFTDLVVIIVDYNLFANFSSKRICEVLSNYIPYKFLYNHEDFTNIFDDPKISKNKELIEDQLSKFNLSNSSLKFNYSTFCFFISQFHKYLKANENKSIDKSLAYYFKVVPELEKMKEEKKRIADEMLVNTDEDPEEDEFEKLMKVEEFPPSTYLEEAKKIEFKPDDIDENFVVDFFTTLDKELPIVPIYDTRISVENGFSMSSNNKYEGLLNINALTKDLNALDVNNLYASDGRLKFPFNTLKNELEIEQERKTLIKENKMIEKAKKPNKNNKKDAIPVKPLDWQEKPTEEGERKKYFGTKNIVDLKKRYFKNSYKNIISNTYVYPSIISEILLIPEKIPNEIKKIIIVGLRNILKGNIDLGLSQLERAQNESNAIKNIDSQISLYFKLIFGGIFINLNYFSMAMKFLNAAKTFSTNMSIGNPDICLVFCYIGDLLLRLNEPEWALRSYWKAKTMRESIIGGDSLDTATVYNNLGVCFYYLNKFYEAYGFLKLAYEIYKEFE